MRVSWVLWLLTAIVSAQKQPFTVDAMMRLGRISEPLLSPDGNTVAFTLERPDLAENKRPKQIYTVATVGGTPVQQITKEGASNHRARWTPDAQRLIYVSDRSGSSQIWSIKADGSDAKQITNLSSAADNVVVSGDGKTLLFTSSVDPGCADDACNKAKAEAGKNSQVKARTYTSLLYRHWKDFQGATRSHLFTVPIEGGTVKDLTPGAHDVPPFSLGGPDDFALSPDGSEVAYVANLDGDAALSTNSDIFLVPVQGGEAKRITTSVGADRSPVYSPDGKYIAFRSQARAGYESDRWRLSLFDRGIGTTTLLNETQDRQVEEITFSPDSSRIFYVVEDRGRTSVQMIPTGGGPARAVVSGNSHIGDVQFSPDGKTMIYAESSGSKPTEIYRASSAGGAAVPLTKINDELLAQYQLTAMEEFWVDHPSDKSRVHSFLVKPPNFEAGKKYPLLVLIHGGPQGAWGESWSYRWNAQAFAGAGYVVLQPNPRGSTGYGQKFTDEINSDWGGKAYEDLRTAVDYAAAQPYVDRDRMAAAGGSYGGYMVNWILGREHRFKALVSHAGVFDLRSMAAETEELWFPIWEFKGMPWDNPELYAQLSPSSYVKEFQTPTLVIHGELDYRVPVGQGMQLFSALQLQKVPSKLVLFPDEGHWILKPQNSVFWYKTFLDWVGEWTRKKGQ